MKRETHLESFRHISKLQGLYARHILFNYNLFAFHYFYIVFYYMYLYAL